MKLNRSIAFPTLGLLCLLLSPGASAAQPLLNIMQGCQAALDFVVQKVDEKPANASTAELVTIREALVNYNEAIQQQLITPGLNTFAYGDSEQVAGLQKQIDGYKASIVTAYNKRYPQPRLYTDYAVVINQCTKQWLPKFGDHEPLKIALTAIIEISRRP